MDGSRELLPFGDTFRVYVTCVVFWEEDARISSCSQGFLSPGKLRSVACHQVPLGGYREQGVAPRGPPQDQRGRGVGGVLWAGGVCPPSWT